MDMGLKNKSALVTGSTRGIGKAIALELAREGVHVLVNGRNNDDVERTIAEIQAAFPETKPLKYHEHDPSGTNPLRERAADHREHIFNEEMTFKAKEKDVMTKNLPQSKSNGLSDRRRSADWLLSSAVRWLPPLKALRSAWTEEWYRQYFNFLCSL